tara:strand:- start:394 stop:1158 length:765 start_codon:yes stop_codon:yes gene_type:complete
MPKLPTIFKKPGALPEATEQVTKGVLDKLPGINLKELIPSGALSKLESNQMKPMSSIPTNVSPNPGLKSDDPAIQEFFGYFVGKDWGADELKYVMDDFDGFIGDIYQDIDKLKTGIFESDFPIVERWGQETVDIKGENFWRVPVPDEGRTKQFIYDETQNVLKKFPEEMYIFRQGDLPEHDGLVSFSIDPNPKKLIFNKESPVSVYKVKKEDIEVAPNLFTKDKLSSINLEEEILVRSQDVEKVGDGTIKNITE